MQLQKSAWSYIKLHGGAKIRMELQLQGSVWSCKDLYRAARIYLLGGTRRKKRAWSFQEHHRATKSYIILQEYSSLSFRDKHGGTRICMELQGAAWSFKDQLGALRNSMKEQHGVSRNSMKLQGTAWSFKEQHGASRNSMKL